MEISIRFKFFFVGVGEIILYQGYTIIKNYTILPAMFMSKKSSLLIAHVVSLLLGGFIYIAFRAEGLLLFDWAEAIGLSSAIEEVRQFFVPMRQNMANWILYSLPDGLWLFSYISLIIYLWQNQVSKQNLPWLVAVPVFIIVAEFGQMAGIVSGTFDILDVLFYLIGAIIPFVLFNPNYKFKSIKS